MKTMAIYNKLGALLTVMSLLVACSADDPAPTTGKATPIRFTASVADATEGTTRAYADAYNASFPTGTDIDVFLYSNNGTTSSDLSTEQFGGASRKWIYTTTGAVDVASGRSLLSQKHPTAAEVSKVDPDDALPQFPANVGENGWVDVFAAFFPEGCNVSPTYSEIVPGTSSFTFDVQTDQTTQTSIVASDFLANDVTATFRTGSSAINLEMKHRMAKVLVEFNATEDLTSDNMPNATYSVLGVKPQLTVAPGTGEISTTGSATTVTAKVGEPFFLPPQEITTDTPFLQFNLRNVGGTDTGIQNVTYKPSQALTLNAGVFYILTVNVGVRYITLTTTIRDWTGEAMTFDKIIL